MPSEPEKWIQGDDEAGGSTLAPAGFVLAPGDTDIFKLIYDYRFLRTEHISALTGRAAKRVHRRLFKLIHAGYLTAIRLPQQKHIYEETSPPPGKPRHRRGGPFLGSWCLASRARRERATIKSPKIMRSRA